MKTYFGKSILCFLLIAALSVLWGCSFRPAPAKTEDGATLFRLGFSGAPDSLNPYDAVNEEAQAVFALLYDRLFTVDMETGKCMPSVCSEYSVTQSASGAVVWHITLRQDVYWHDGQRLTASDVEFTLQSAKDYSTLYGYPLCEKLDTTGIDVQDDTHFDMVVWAGEEYILQCLARIPILPRHIWNAPASMQYGSAGVAADPARARKDLLAMKTDAAVLIGSGPYTFSGFENGVCTLRRSESYWNGVSGPGAVELRYNAADPFAAMSEGLLDGCWDMSLSAWKALSDEKGVGTAAGTAGEQYFIGFDFTGSSPVRDVQIRQALERCVNRQAILLLAFGGGYADSGLLSPFSHWRNSGVTAENRDYSPEAAGQTLERAGITDRNADGIRELPNGDPLTLTLITHSGQAWETAAYSLKNTCTQAGIGLELRFLTPLAFGEAQASGNYDILLSVRQTTPEPYMPFSSFYWDHGDNDAVYSDGSGRVSSRGWNENGYANEDYDTLYEALMAAEEEEAILDAVSKAGSALYEDAAYVGIGFSVTYQAHCSVWYGFRVDRVSGLYFTPLTLSQQLRGIGAGGK